MLEYIFDGTFEGLLTSIYDAYYSKKTPSRIISMDLYENNLLTEGVYVKADALKADKVYDAIIKKISFQSLENCIHAFLSEHPDSGLWIYEYIKFGFKIGRDLDSYLTDDRVLQIHKLCQKVLKEKHLLLGLLRFKHLNNRIYYATIEPQYNTIGLIADHFSKRMSEQLWVIHDQKRNIGVFYDKNSWYIRDIYLENSLVYDDEEIFFQKLWKEYHHSISISERNNPKLQRAHMPLKYWKHLVELDKNIY